ncbi:hypothetical protein DSO57_1024069 [Entomophthora muscae]|uniref:Uncharacterized protein n=1 Tax=Entomophthora muscae TaxID=34485 RepID=A0ACC2RTT0_9FUNG|nr:hypothetical protein DSO57_1024069 [Entomophthora muscae]
MDFSSGAAVLALGVEKGDQILELCCAPGAKLCFMSDLLAIKERGCDKEFRSGNITGVDIAEHRLFTCRSLIKKYKTAYRTRLFLADGTTFNVLPPIDLRFSKRTPKKLIASKENYLTQAASSDGTNVLKTDNLLKQTAPFYAPRHLRLPGRTGLPNSTCLIGYDKVLVDAECTHDGSIMHVLKYRLGKPIGIRDAEENPSSEAICEKTFNLDKFDSTVLDDSRVAVLSSLQLDLLQQGYRLLNPGGTLVYSTCSLTIDQNETVIARFIHAQIGNSAFPVVESPSPFLPSSIPAANPKYLTTSILETHGIATEHHEYIRECVSQAIRYDPIVSETSGLFIARLRKPPLSGDKIMDSAQKGK